VPVVSLAHAQGEAVAFAALVEPGTEARIGIDVEHLRRRPPGFEEAAMSDDERRLLEGLPADVVDEWLLRCWCAKEAAGKALGSGLTAAPAVASIDRDRGQVDVDVDGQRLLVGTLREGELIVATTLGERGGS